MIDHVTANVSDFSAAKDFYTQTLAPLGYRPGTYPVSEKMASRILSLPFFPEMTPQQMDLVVREFSQVARP